jgi:hypothetical protein
LDPVEDLEEREGVEDCYSHFHSLVHGHVRGHVHVVQTEIEARREEQRLFQQEHARQAISLPELLAFCEPDGYGNTSLLQNIVCLA